MLAYFNEGFKPLVAIIIHGLPADQGSYLTNAVTTSVASKIYDFQSSFGSVTEFQIQMVNSN